MSKSEIHNIQDFLTIKYPEEDRKHQIVNVEFLLRRHEPQAVIKFLEQLHKEYSKKLKTIIRKDKTSHRLSDILGKKWRIKMSINLIKNYAKEGGKAA